MWKMVDGSFPYLDSVASETKWKPPIPYQIMEQKSGEYPHYISTAKETDYHEPFPYMVFHQTPNEFDGFPHYHTTAKTISTWKNPLPYLYYEPNQADEIEYKIVIPDYKIKVAVPKYDVVIQNEVII